MILIAIVLIVGLVAAVFAAFTLWEVALNKAGATVIVAEDSVLMRRWREKHGEGEEPHNLCQVIRNAVSSRIADIIDEHPRMVAGVIISFVLALVVLLFVAAFAAFRAGEMADGSTTLKYAALAVVGITAEVGVIFALASWSARKGRSWMAVLAFLAATQLRLCPPIEIQGKRD